MVTKLITKQNTQDTLEKKLTAERDRCLTTYTFLERRDRSKRSRHALAAYNIRLELKRAFPGVKFLVHSDSFAGGDAVDVHWTDGPTYEEVDRLISKYSRGRFDGQEEIYNYASGVAAVFGELFGNTKYVTQGRSYSDKTITQTIADCHTAHDNPSNPVPTLEAYRKGQLREVFPARHYKSYAELVSDTLSKKNFVSVGPKIKAGVQNP